MDIFKKSKKNENNIASPGKTLSRNESKMVDSKKDEQVSGKAAQEPNVTAANEVSPEETARMERLKRVEKIATQNPEEVAALLKNWLSKDY